jgi:hypothetical protein
MQRKRKVQTFRFRCIGGYAEGIRAHNEHGTGIRGFNEQKFHRESERTVVFAHQAFRRFH